MRRQGDDERELATATLTVRLPPLFKARVTEAARQSDRTVSLWVIRACKEKLAKSEED